MPEEIYQSEFKLHDSLDGFSHDDEGVLVISENESTAIQASNDDLIEALSETKIKAPDGTSLNENIYSNFSIETNDSSIPVENLTMEISGESTTKLPIDKKNNRNPLYIKSENVAPDIIMENFEGPLDLLCYLIEKNKINIYDIPIVMITDQYLDYIAKIPGIDLDFMSEFLVMASTLLHIKSRLLLPSKQSTQSAEDSDPREELVMKLLEYRRCKALASELKERHEMFRKCVYKLPETAQSLGFPSMKMQEDFSVEQFYRACKAVTERNEMRFNDVSNKIMHILRREKISLKEKMKIIWNQVVNKTKVFFNELFPSTTTSKAERVVGFLALLELLKLDRITAKQEKAFDVILIECDPGKVKGDEQIFDRHFTKEKFEEIAYL